MTPERIRSAAARLGRHPQDHGWRELYRLVAKALERSDSQLTSLVSVCMEARPYCSDTHIVTLLGIALKSTLSSKEFNQLVTLGDITRKLTILNQAADTRGDEISSIICFRQNSFTGSRRFLVPQTLLGAYFASRDDVQINFADLGTGLGITPRQLNSKALYDRFSPGLIWPDGIPLYRSIPLLSRFGVDCGSIPSLEWVHMCYGHSSYYATLYEELLSVVNSLDTRSADVSYSNVNMLDRDALLDFISDYNINVVNLCYVLYEIQPSMRQRVLDMLIGALSPPGVIIVTEPYSDLTQRGCSVTLYDVENVTPLALCYVSDGHFIGEVKPLDDYDRFVNQYPIIFDR